MHRSFRLLGLYGLCLALPLLDVLGSHPDFFVARRSRPIDLVLLASVVIALPPLVLWLVESALGLLGGRVRKLAHYGLCGALLGALAFRGLREVTSAHESLALMLAALTAALFGVALARSEHLRAFCAWLAICAPLYLLHFLLLSPASQIVTPAPTELPGHDERVPQIPIVMIVLDELPLLSLLDADERIDAERLPGFARLASTATWFRNATTTADQTVLAVPSILTGRRASGRTPADFEHHPESLFTFLTPSHEIHALESVTHLCPRDLCREVVAPLGRRIRALLDDAGLVAFHVWLPTALTRDLPHIDDRWTAFGGDPDALGPDETFAYFASQLRGGGPTFDYLHVLSPHGPWEHLPTGQRYGSSEALRRPAGLESGTWSGDPYFGQLGLGRHLLEVGNVDRLLGELMDDLDRRGLFDPALIVVVSDHGVSFAPGEPWRSVTPGNRVELMTIPFFLKAPGQRKAAVVDRNIETIDVLPTIADVLGVRIPWAIDGHSALDPGVPERTSKRIENWQMQSTLEFDDFPAARSGALRARLTRVEKMRREGPEHPLVGASIEDSETFGELGDVQLDDAGAFAAVDLDSSFVPLYVSGTVAFPIEAQSTPPPWLAIAIDGEVRTITRPHSESSGRWRFTAVLPAASLQPGANRVHVRSLLGELRKPGTQGGRPHH